MKKEPWLMEVNRRMHKDKKARQKKRARVKALRKKRAGGGNNNPTGPDN